MSLLFFQQNLKISYIFSIPSATKKFPTALNITGELCIRPRNEAVVTAIILKTAHAEHVLLYMLYTSCVCHTPNTSELNAKQVKMNYSVARFPGVIPACHDWEMPSPNVDVCWQSHAAIRRCTNTSVVLQLELWYYMDSDNVYHASLSCKWQHREIHQRLTFCFDVPDTTC